MPRKCKKRKMSILYCCVPGCEETSARKKTTEFHPFPRDDSLLGRRRLQRWLKAIGTNLKPTSRSKVCEAHFRLYRPVSEKKNIQSPKKAALIDEPAPAPSPPPSPKPPSPPLLAVKKVYVKKAKVLDVPKSIPVENAQKLLTEFNVVLEDVSRQNLKVRSSNFFLIRNETQGAEFAELNYQDWLHNEIELSLLSKHNEEIMKSFQALGQHLADNQRELQLLLNQFKKIDKNRHKHQVEQVQLSLTEVTLTRQKCMKEIRECIQLGDELNFRNNQRWDFIRRLSDAQELLQHLFDELVDFHHPKAQCTNHMLGQETEQSNRTSEKRKRSRSPWRRISLSSNSSEKSSVSDPLDLSNFSSQEPTVEDFIPVSIQPELARETELNDKDDNDAAHHQLLPSDPGSDSYRPSVAVKQEVVGEQKEEIQQQPVKLSGSLEKAPCVRLTLIGNQIVNMETNAVIADLNAIPNAAGHSNDGRNKLDPQTLLSIMKLLPGVKKSLRVVAVPATPPSSGPPNPCPQRSLTNGSEVITDKTNVSMIPQLASVNNDSSKCLTSTSVSNSTSVPRIISDLSQQRSPTCNQVQRNVTQQPNQQHETPTKLHQQNRDPKPNNLSIPTRFPLNLTDTAATTPSATSAVSTAPAPTVPAPTVPASTVSTASKSTAQCSASPAKSALASKTPCVRLTLVDGKIVNMETKEVIADLNAMGATKNEGQLDHATLASIIKLLPGAKKSLRVVSVPPSRPGNPVNSVTPSSSVKNKPKF